MLGMVAALSVALYGAMYTGLKARNIARQQSADLRTATIVMDFIERDLQSVMMPTGTLSGPFIGLTSGTVGFESDTLDFYAIGRDYGSDTIFAEGFRRIVIGMKSNGSTSQLVRQVTRNLLSDGTAEPEEEVLAEDVVGFSVGYYDSTTSSWTEEWDSTELENAMPTLLEVTLRIRKSDPKLVDQSYSITRLIYLPCGGAAPTSPTTETGGAS